MTCYITTHFTIFVINIYSYVISINRVSHGKVVNILYEAPIFNFLTHNISAILIVFLPIVGDISESLSREGLKKMAAVFNVHVLQVNTQYTAFLPLLNS